MRPFAIVLMVFAAACADPEAERRERESEVVALLGRLAEPAAFARVVELGEVGPLLRATDPGTPEETGGLACLALGRIGGEAARARLEELAKGGDGELARYARAGLDGLTPEQFRELGAREAEARGLVARLEEPAIFDRVVELAAVAPVAEATAADSPDRVRHLACLVLGRIGGEEARDHLLRLLAAPTPDPQRDGAMRLYAAVGLTLLADPGTAVDLVLHLSTVNPNDNIAALAAEGQAGDYYTVDAQICEALLSMGLWTAEDELVAQLRRRDYVRVLIDAYAVLRRHTGLDLPFRYNASYRDRNADADAWARKLVETRAERQRRRPFDGTNARFRSRCRDMMAWLGGQSVNDRYIAEKVLQRLGSHAIPFLAEALETGGRSAQRESALVLGRIGDPVAAPALRQALRLADGKARALAIDALRRIGDREAAAVVAPLLEDDDREVRANAATFLGEFGDSTHVDALRAALEGETGPATVTAISCALLRLGDLAQIDRLLEIFVDGEQLERRAARDALWSRAPDWEADPLAPREERAAAAGRFPR